MGHMTYYILLNAYSMTPRLKTAKSPLTGFIKNQNFSEESALHSR